MKGKNRSAVYSSVARWATALQDTSTLHGFTLDLLQWVCLTVALLRNYSQRENVEFARHFCISITKLLK